ncbi:hypothetical protein So717_28070 [Roseobacter cerasinus]|uniref:Uncharacterized protein n=1 Tax=Roseobacter cerasinus TaxID=2602289 RepID=A0A640VTZ0_9RHOB|nr:hypothetical protein So717_28070 [Roseobacter cerasinus]
MDAEFLSGLHQQLHANAYAQKGPLPFKVTQDRCIKTRRSQLFGGTSKCTHTRQDQTVSVSNAVWIGAQYGRGIATF